MVKSCTPVQSKAGEPSQCDCCGLHSISLILWYFCRLIIRVSAYQKSTGRMAVLFEQDCAENWELDAEQDSDSEQDSDTDSDTDTGSQIFQVEVAFGYMFHDMSLGPRFPCKGSENGQFVSRGPRMQWALLDQVISQQDQVWDGSDTYAVHGFSLDFDLISNDWHGFRTEAHFLNILANCCST